MSGILGSKNSKSGRITNICDPFPTYGGLTVLNYLICALGDVNMNNPDSTQVIISMQITMLMTLLI